MSPAPLLLLTRPVEESRELSEVLEKRGYATALAPMLEIAPLPFTLPEPVENFDALIFTSASAVRVFAATSAFRAAPRLYAVGPQTAQAARDSGFHNVVTAEGDSESLARCITGHDGSDDPRMTRQMLHLRGEDVASDIGQALEKHNISVISVICYRARAAQALPPETIALLHARQIDSILFFSARTARIFLSLAEAANCIETLSSVRALCLSRRVVESSGTAPWRTVEIAGTPDRGGMLALLPDRTTGAFANP